LQLQHVFQQLNDFSPGAATPRADPAANADLDAADDDDDNDDDDDVANDFLVVHAEFARKKSCPDMGSS
jgi:hypothetical protein